MLLLCLFANVAVARHWACFFFQEYYKRMKYAVIIWGSATGFAIIENIAEAAYATAIPQKVMKQRQWDKISLVNAANQPIVIESDDHTRIKDNLVTAWALTGVHACLYVRIKLNISIIQCELKKHAFECLSRLSHFVVTVVSLHYFIAILLLFLYVFLFL